MFLTILLVVLLTVLLSHRSLFWRWLLLLVAALPILLLENVRNSSSLSAQKGLFLPARLRRRLWLWWRWLLLLRWLSVLLRLTILRWLSLRKGCSST